MRKWIGYYQNIISNDLCDKLIDYSDNQKPLQPSTYRHHLVNQIEVMKE